MITVARLAPFNQWDQNLLDELFGNRLADTGIEFSRIDGYPGDVDGCILIIPGRYWVGRGNLISEALNPFKWVLCIRTGDEEDLFDTVERIVHPNIKHWIQTPHRRYNARYIGVGYPPHFNTVPARERDLDVFLSGQNTHTRRTQCFNALKRVTATKCVAATEGFTQGFPTDEYTDHMCRAKIAPCPSGASSPDSFRVWEALQAHTIPIADDLSPTYNSAGFWDMICPGAPFPIIHSYKSLPGYINDQLGDWPAKANRVTAWWMRYKRNLALGLRNDLEALGAI